MGEFRPAAVVPTYDNAATIATVVKRLSRDIEDVIVVDDGSGRITRDIVSELAQGGLVRAVHRETNGGKGAAVKTGLATAHALGFTHVLQVDADGQHELEDVPRFLEAARQNPEALILGRPLFDKSVPLGRLLGRQLTVFWTHVETCGRQIADPMCGFRVYPLAALEGLRCGDRMEFDIEIAVRLVWKGLSVINLPTKVRYLSKEEGGLSHFRMLEDNLLITWMHTRLVLGMLARLVTWPFRVLFR